MAIHETYKAKEKKLNVLTLAVPLNTITFNSRRLALVSQFHSSQNMVVEDKEKEILKVIACSIRSWRHYLSEKSLMALRSSLQRVQYLSDDLFAGYPAIRLES